MLHELLDIRLWAGTEQSLAAYMAVIESMMKDGKLPDRSAFYKTGGDEQRGPRLLSVNDGVATVAIHGPLNNSASWINELFGMTGYPEIRDAMTTAAQDPKVKAIVLDISSGGGSVAGLEDTAELVAKIDKQVKPVTAFTASAMLSAAYRLGVAAREITITKSAEVGSIGVVAVHQEMTKMAEKAGVTPTIFRSGKYKALGHPLETLSETAKEEIQASVDYSAEIFTQAVADARGVSYQVANSKMGQGRVFPGERGVDVGLADAIGTFDDVIEKAQDVKPKENIRGGIASGKSAPQYGAHSEGQPLKNALTQAQIAAIAAGGVALDADGKPVVIEQPTQEQLDAQALADKEAADLQAAADKKAAEDKAAADEQAAAEAAAKPSNDAVVKYLQGEIAGKDARIAELTIEARDAKAASEAQASDLGAMRAITVDAVNYLRVAMGHASGSAEAMSNTELLAAHASLREQFEKKFKAGGVAAVPAAKPADKEGQAAVDPVRLARIQATRLK